MSIFSFIPRTIFAALILCSIDAAAQQKNSVAQVEVSVTNSQQQPLRGEEVIFVTSDYQTSLSRKTNIQGKCMLELSSGKTYTVKLRSFEDTTSYSTLDIPALKAGESFDGAFTVSIVYDPSKTYTLNNILFDSGKPTFRPDSYKQLNDLAEYMQLKPDQRFEIDGHTDNVGKPEENLKLSQLRAEAVKNFLVKKGVKADRIIAKGRGATQPVADNNSAEGKRKNRRTELVLL